MAQIGKSELASRIAEKAGISATQANKVLNAAIESVSEALADGDEVRLTGFGSFKVSETKARTGRHPRTGEPLEIPAGRRVSFTPGGTLTSGLKGGMTKAA
jgi:DNA-binding protein HU-beta